MQGLVEPGKSLREHMQHAAANLPFSAPFSENTKFHVTRWQW
jgi:hypothetical protein